MKKILVVDDHPAIRMAVKIILLDKNKCEINEADNGVDAIAMIRRDNYDTIILDIGIPKMNGIEVIKRIRKISGEIVIMVLSAQDKRDYTFRCLLAGANGFLSKMNDLGQLRDALACCHAGKKYFPSDLLRQYSRGKQNPDINLIDSLSDRELSVLTALCRGYSNKEIAADMLLSEKTVSTYKTRLMNKLNVNNMVNLLDFYKRNFELEDE
ncbi:two-component system response regulator EvgA [Aeromonas hydrophila]|uniref:response regulator transcription factor n=1 Tax=Aeromonas hydrophila TaxID=644 RepID=UPI0021687CAD|nr:response regulator transcription factor [Aeromonas hydrophila]MCS3770598.1 two-component system response regulator EvgA [Aeromonas hydrophila]MCS3794038.1 two-component system response regulator EvgA [Aeromonas hydrophila]